MHCRFSPIAFIIEEAVYLIEVFPIAITLTNK